VEPRKSGACAVPAGPIEPDRAVAHHSATPTCVFIEMSLQPQAIESARAEFSAGRFATAEATCLEILRLEPSNPEVLHLLGLIRFQAGRGQEGAQLLERAVQAAPGFAAAQNDLGAMLVILDRLDEAVPRLRTAIGLSPGSAEAHLNLGNALHARGEPQAAEGHYRTALAIDSRNVRANLSLGNWLRQMHRPEEAVKYLSAAVALAPGAAAAHIFLGNALVELARTGDAVGSYRQAIAIEPSNADANVGLGHLLVSQGHHEEALLCFRTASARAEELACLLHLGRHADFFEDLERHEAAVATDLDCASLSAYAAYHLGRPDPHVYCPNPLDHVRIIDLYTDSGAQAQFLCDLIREVSQLNAVWEPGGLATTRGFQTNSELFLNSSGALDRLKGDLVEELGKYFSEFGQTGITLVKNWPTTTRLQGWYVRLVTGGHQHFHNHPYGWMSGCLYLQMPKLAPPGEGAIEFGLNRGNYPKLSDKPPPTLLHHPKPGQVVLFPSSLFHRTIPFHSDEERLCIAFDLLPDAIDQQG